MKSSCCYQKKSEQVLDKENNSLQEVSKGGQSAHSPAFTCFQLTLEFVQCPTLSVLEDLQNLGKERKQTVYTAQLCLKRRDFPCWGARSHTQPQSLPPFLENQMEQLLFLFLPTFLTLRLENRAFLLVLSFPLQVVLDDHLNLIFFQCKSFFTGGGSTRPQASSAIPITNRILNSELWNKHLKPVMSKQILRYSSTRAKIKTQLISQKSHCIKLGEAERNNHSLLQTSCLLTEDFRLHTPGVWPQCPPLIEKERIKIWFQLYACRMTIKRSKA